MCGHTGLNLKGHQTGSVFHMHNKSVRRVKFAVGGLLKEGKLVGVAIAGRRLAQAVYVHFVMSFPPLFSVNA